MRQIEKSKFITKKTSKLIFTLLLFLMAFTHTLLASSKNDNSVSSIPQPNNENIVSRYPLLKYIPFFNTNIEKPNDDTNIKEKINSTYLTLQVAVTLLAIAVLIMISMSMKMNKTKKDVDIQKKKFSQYEKKAVQVKKQAQEKIQTFYMMLWAILALLAFIILYLLSRKQAW